MSIQAFATQNYDGAWVDKGGNLTVGAARFVLALFARTGQGNGIIPLVDTELAATGATLADALGLTKDWNLIETGAANSGVRILPLKPGNDIVVWNISGSNKNIYPPDANTQIDALGNGNPFVLAPQKLRVFQCWTVPPDPGRFASFGN